MSEAVVFEEDFSMLVEAGFIAVKQLDEISARRLFKAAAALCPENSAPKLGFGYIALNKLQVAEAAALFEEVLQAEPDHHLAQALLGIAYLLSKDNKAQGEQLILSAQKNSQDPAITNLTSVALKWKEKDLVKSKPLA